jgi:transposase
LTAALQIETKSAIDKKAGMPQKAGNWQDGSCLVRVWEVIPVNKSKSYRSIPVKQVDLEKVVSGHLNECVEAGLDIGKHWIWVMVRFRDDTYLRPWRASNPLETPALVSLLKRLGERVKLTVALESSGTYGDPLRQAMSDAGLNVHRVRSKASHDWAESFDGVPSQHDGKDAGVVAELCANGKSVPWPLHQPVELEQEIAYWVDRMDAAQRVQQVWTGRLESRLARHWPEVCGVLKLSSSTLLQALRRWAGPAGLAADAQAAQRLRDWSNGMLEEQTIDRLVNEARTSVGVRMSSWDQRRVREDAGQALRARVRKSAAEKRLRELAARHELIPALGAVVGIPTACVLWVCVGDPRCYGSGAAYRKAMGLNLAERSSGMYKGQLRISKRGKSLPRRFLYFAALRYVSKAPVKQWYLEKKRRDGQEGMRGVVAVMRKLPLAVHAAAQGVEFDARRLFNSIVNSDVKHMHHVKHEKNSPTEQRR